MSFLFFIVIWPQDVYRHVIARNGADVWFWTSIAMIAVFGGLSVLAFRRLATTRAGQLRQAPAPVRA